MTYNGATYYYVYNMLGDIIGLSNIAGNLVVSYKYHPYGEVKEYTDTSGINLANINPFRYKGYYFDTETSYYYLNSRYYDPELCRFLNADGYVSTGQGLTGLNMFAYCGNNPVMNFDESGLWWRKVVDFVKDAAKIVCEITEHVAAKVAEAATEVVSTVREVCGGGIYRQTPNGLSTALTAQSNSLSAVSKGARVTSKAAGVVSYGVVATDTAVDVYRNFNNDNLTLSRKISDSVVDVSVAAANVWGAAAIGSAVGTAIPVPGVGTAVGFAAGIIIGSICEYTPIVGWTKDCAGWVANKIGGLFG